MSYYLQYAIFLKLSRLVRHKVSYQPKAITIKADHPNFPFSKMGNY